MWTIKVKSKSYNYKHLKSVVFSIYNTYNKFIDKAIWENLHNNHKINNTGINSFKVVKDHYKKKFSHKEIEATWRIGKTVYPHRLAELIWKWSPKHKQCTAIIQ